MLDLFFFINAQVCECLNLMARGNKKKFRNKLSPTISAHLFTCCQQENKLLSNTIFFLFPRSFPLLFSILTWCEALQWLSPKLLSSLPYLDLHHMQLGGLYFRTAVWRDLGTSSWLHASNKIWQIPGPMIWWHILSFQWAFPGLITNNFTSATEGDEKTNLILIKTMDGGFVWQTVSRLIDFWVS